MSAVHPRRIVVGVDGSEPSARALEWACAIADRFGSEIVAVHAIGLLAHLGPQRVVPAQAHRDELERAVADWTAPLARRRQPSRTLLVDGEASIVILDVAAAEDADLLVVGTRGLGQAPGRLLGSTAHRVAQQSDRPVLLVPSHGGSGRG